MARYYFQLLGSPQIKIMGEEQTDSQGYTKVVRFRYRDTWLLLASLVLEPQIKRREALMHRLALDSKKSAKETLRFRLHDLRHGDASRRSTNNTRYCGIGKETIFADGEIIVLKSGIIQTDLQEIEAILAKLRTLATPQQRLSCLKQGATLLRGTVMDGFDASLYPEQWLETLRFQGERMAADLWFLLARDLDANSERRSAFDAARKAYTLSPENPEMLELLLDLAEGAREREDVLQLSKQLGLEGLHSRLEELEREGQALTFTEEHALQEAIQLRLAQLSQKASAGLKRVACFPQDFTAQQAEAITNVSVDTLTRLVTVFPLQKRDERYYLLPALRFALQSLLTESEKVLMSQHHAHYFANLLKTGPTGDRYDIEQREVLREECEHLLMAIHWFQGQPPSSSGVFLLHNCWLWLEELPQIRMALYQAVDYLEAAIDVLGEPDGRTPAEFLGQIALSQQDFKKALHWFQLALERFHPVDEHIWIHILHSAHHGGEDDTFDHYAHLILNNWPIPNLAVMPDIGKKLFQQSIYGVVAENRMARRNFSEALEHNAKAFSLRREANLGEDSAPPLWGQRAAILGGLRRIEESEQCWDRALKGYEAQGNRGGVAECYQEIGRIVAKRGQGGLGISLLHQAITIFGEQGNFGAVAAAQGTLGDICLDLGETEKARDLYEQGLAYWQTQKHPRWTERFQKRMESLRK